MGYEKIKRPLLTPGGLQVTGASTFTAAPTWSGVGPVQAVQTLSSASTGTVITAYGVTTIWQTVAGTTNQTFKLAAPVVGTEKTIFVTPGARTVTITCTAGGTDPFYKSTDSVSIQVSSDADNAMIQAVGVTSLLTGATGTKWAVTYMSTAIAYA
jgi:hypothetical protein